MKWEGMDSRTMRFETSQHMKLGQQMKLAPRMIQSMEILQMSMMALQERIDQELESNIALEQLEPDTDMDQIASSEAHRRRRAWRSRKSSRRTRRRSSGEGPRGRRLSRLSRPAGPRFDCSDR